MFFCAQIVFSSSLASGVLIGFSVGYESGEASKGALGLGVPDPKKALGLMGEPCSEVIGLEGMFPEEGLGWEQPGWRRPIRGSWGPLDWGSILRLCVSFMWGTGLEDYFGERWRRLWTGQCSAWWWSWGARESVLLGLATLHGKRKLGLSGSLQAVTGSSSSEELDSTSSSSISLSFKGSSLISELSSPWAGLGARSSSLLRWIPSHSLRNVWRDW